MGSIAPVTQETLDEIEQLGLEDKHGHGSMGEAVKELEEYLGKPIGCLVAAELGAGNTPAPLVTGARLGIPVVDGDYAGRAIPDEMQGTPYLYGKHSWPFASVDKWGNIAIVKYTVNPHMLERIGKFLAVAAYGSTTMAATPLPAKDACKGDEGDTRPRHADPVSCPGAGHARGAGKRPKPGGRGRGSNRWLASL
jgi:hypothetical protein